VEFKSYQPSTGKGSLGVVRVISATEDEDGDKGDIYAEKLALFSHTLSLALPRYHRRATVG
jgi:hypothetical protein